MAFSPSVTHFISLPRRLHSTLSNYSCSSFVQLQNQWGGVALVAMSQRKVVGGSDDDDTENPSENGVLVAKRNSSRRPATRSRVRKKVNGPEENHEPVEEGDGITKEESFGSLSDDDLQKLPRRGRRKAATASSSLEEEKIENKVKRRGRRKKSELMDDTITEDQGGQSDIDAQEESSFLLNMEYESDGDLDFGKDYGEDIRHTYGWPPLVCCFGSALHAFIPSARPANRLINHEIHETMKDAYWQPEKFMRSPGGCAASVAIALASIGGKVAFMGKLGDDDYGQAMLYYMNVNNVQTRSVRVDTKRVTALSTMKLAKRGRLRTTCIKVSAEDSLTKSDINIDVLMEAKMFYFSTHSLLDQSMRSTTLQAVKVSKKLGADIFYDLNIPLPLWRSSEETKEFIRLAWNLADIVEVTKQELEFLCGISPTEEFNTKNNDSSKFIHYGPDVVAPLWHENLKVLFVSNGTSTIHYYTNEHNGAVHGTEDAPITPFTSDMSASGDGIVAGLMRMLTVQPDLITDKEYLEHSIRYAIDCGIIDQWLLGRTRGFPPREDMEEDEVEPDANGIRSITEQEYRTIKSIS